MTTMRIDPVPAAPERFPAAPSNTVPFRTTLAHMVGNKRAVARDVRKTHRRVGITTE